MEAVSDVIVVGAGPVGMMLGLHLAKQGHSITIVERYAAPYPLPRAIAMGHDSLRSLNAAGVGKDVRQMLFYDDKLVTAGFVDRYGELLMEMRFKERSESGGPEGCAFNQPDLEASLERHVRAQPNIRLLRGRAVVTVRQDGEGAEVLTVPADASGNLLEGQASQPLRAKYVVGCDGANSIVRRTMDVPITDLDFAWDWLVVDIQPTSAREWKLPLGQWLGPPRTVTWAPSGPGRRRFEFMLLEGESREAMSKTETVWALLGECGVDPSNAQLVRHAVYTFKALWADRWRQGRLFLAGDAAHLTPPFLGQGMNSGIRDAVTLAWRLSLVLRGLAPAQSLDDYGAERLPHVSAQIEQAVQIGRLLCVTEPEACEERDGMLRFMRDNPDAAPPLPVWRMGPGALADGDPEAGLIGWQGIVRANDQEGEFDDICGANRFVLLGRTGDPLAALSPEARNIWNRLDGIAVHVSPEGPVVDVEGIYAQWFERTGSQIILVRPDFFVFGTGASLADADRLVRDLARKLHLETENLSKETTA